MSGDPTDLIREADAYVQPNPQFRSLYAPGADLVRRLTGRVEQERSRAFHLRAALAEANATIQRVEALADEWEAGIGGTVAALAIRRAIKEHQPKVCDECSNAIGSGHYPWCSAGDRERTILANALAGLIQDTTEGFVPLDARYGLANAILSEFAIKFREQS